ncbi:MAG: ribonuclease H-like domain-containing protein [Armatimonadetes bacterium]|nr:ribonuclease H-like domain-containing protein [Armatimonadota bacterium]
MDLDAATRRRLSALGRQGAPPPPSEPAPPRARTVRIVGDPGELHGALEELLPGTPRAVDEGELYELILPVATLGDWALDAVRVWEQAARAAHLPGNVPPEQIVFFDTETTALSNAPLFLVGVLGLSDDGPVIRQLLARDYAEEPAVLAEARRLLHDAGRVVSYNGNGFDVPYLRDRLRYHRLGSIHLPGHLDLLPVARRKLGRSLGDCKLQTLELHLCGRQRGHDIAGAEIPQAYHDFVADGDAWQMRRIIEHNAYDVVTLAELAAHLAD